MSLVSGTAYGIAASRILRFARTIRCAIVAAGTRNERAKRQRDLRVGGKRGVAAGEDQPKTIVGDLGRLVVGLLDGLVEPRRSVRVERFFGPRPAPDAIDRLVAGGLNDPGARKLRDAGGPPLIHGGRKRLLRRLFGQVEVADE